MPCLLRHTLTIGSLSIALAAVSASAATRTKADNLDNLDQGTSWVGGVVPTSSDTALFDSTLSAANTTLSLGTDTNWLGISLTSPGAAVTINAINNLILSGGGVDMSTASQDLTLGPTLNLAGTNTMNIGAGRTLTISGVISGTNGLVKTGPGLLNLTVQNVYTNGTIASNGIIVLGSTAATLGSNTIANPITFFGGAISNNWGANNQVSVNNPIIVPTGQTGTIYMGNRIRLASNGNGAPITGGGILNIVCNSTVTRDDIGNPAGAFTGTVNFVGTGGVRLFVNAGAFTGFSNAIVNLDGAIAWNFNDNSGGNFFDFGHLAGTNTAAQIGFTSAGAAPRLVVGRLNTDTTLAAQLVAAASLMKVGTGTLTLPAAHIHTGTNFVVGGKLVGVTGGSMSNAISTIVSNGATFGVFVGPAGPQWVGPPMTNQNTSALEINYGGSAPSTTLAPLLVRGNFAPSNTTTINIKGGSWASTGVYPLIKYTGSLLGDGGNALILGTQPTRVLGYLSNDTATTSIDYVVTNVTSPLFWATGNGVWDINNTPNWKDATGATTTYQEAGGFGNSVLFEDTQSGSSPITVTLNTTVVPVAASVSASKNYTLSGSGSISGVGSLRKAGSGTLTVSTVNAFTGGTFVNGGLLNFSSLGNLGAASSPILFGGGTLQYASGNTADISTRTVTFSTGDGSIDTGGNNVVFANPVGNNGAGGVTKTGAGTLTLNGANRYLGNTIVRQGSLALAAGASLSNSVSLVVSNGAVLDAAASGLVLNGAVSQNLGGNGTVNGVITLSAGTTLSPGASPGTITLANDLNVSGGTLVMDVSTNASGRDLIVVSGTTTFSSGALQLVPSTTLTNGSYRLMQVGGVSGSAGSLLLLGFAQSGQIAFLSDATPGEIDLVVANGSTNNLVWAGTGNAWDVGLTSDWSNTLTTASSVFIQGDTVTFDDTGAAAPTVNLSSLLYPSVSTPQRVNVTGSTSYTLLDSTGSGRLIGPASIAKSGSGTLTLAMVNNNIGPTVISGGTVQVGNGGATGNLGFGNVTNNAALVFNQPDDRSVQGTISGNGSVVQQGAATLTFTKNNNYAGPTTISSGVLQVGAGGATGTLGSGPVTNAGTLVFNRSGTFTNTTGIFGSGTPNPAAVIVNGTATLTLASNNTYEGNTYISNGIVKLGKSEVIPDGGATSGWLILDGGPTFAGTLDLNGFNETVNALSGLGGTVLGRIINSVASTTNTLRLAGIADTTFAGNILDNAGTGGRVAIFKDGATTLTLSGPNSAYSGGTIVAAGTLTLRSVPGAGTGSITCSNGTTVSLAGLGTANIANNIVTAPGASVSLTCDNLASGHGGLFFSGDSTSSNLIAGSLSIGAPATKQFSNFFGTVVVQDTFNMRFSSTSLNVNGGDNTTFVIGTGATLNTRNGTGNGEGIALGVLLGPGTLSGASGGNTGTSRYNIGAKGVNCTFDGAIVGSGDTQVVINKVGAATLTLTGTLTYEGTTTVSNGLMVLTSSAVLDNSTNLLVRAGAALVLDPSGSTGGTLTLGNIVPQALGGSGTVRASVNCSANSFVNPGDGIGTLIVTNSVTLAGSLNMELNRTNTPATNDMLAAASITAGGTLTVVNVGTGLRSGDSFKLLSGPISGTFAAINLPPLSPCLSWNTSSLYTAGTISVSGSLCPPTLSSSRSGTNLTLSWGTEYMNTGWVLQQQTNAWNVGLTTNWTIVAGSGATNQVVLTISPTNGSAFYRLFYQ